MIPAEAKSRCSNLPMVPKGLFILLGATIACSNPKPVDLSTTVNGAGVQLREAEGFLNLASGVPTFDETQAPREEAFLLGVKHIFSVDTLPAMAVASAQGDPMKLLSRNQCVDALAGDEQRVGEMCSGLESEILKKWSMCAFALAAATEVLPEAMQECPIRLSETGPLSQRGLQVALARTILEARVALKIDSATAQEHLDRGSTMAEGLGLTETEQLWLATDWPGVAPTVDPAQSIGPHYLLENGLPVALADNRMRLNESDVLVNGIRVADSARTLGPPKRWAKTSMDFPVRGDAWVLEDASGDPLQISAAVKAICSQTDSVTVMTVDKRSTATMNQRETAAAVRRVECEPFLAEQAVEAEKAFEELASAPGTVSLSGDPIILGALDRDLLDSKITENLLHLKACYSRALVDQPSMSGKVTVKFVIAKDGTVSKASIKNSTIDDDSFTECLTASFLSFSFAEPKGGGIVIASYPFLFSSET